MTMNELLSQIGIVFSTMLTGIGTLLTGLTPTLFFKILLYVALFIILFDLVIHIIQKGFSNILDFKSKEQKNKKIE